MVKPYGLLNFLKIEVHKTTYKKHVIPCRSRSCANFKKSIKVHMQNIYVFELNSKSAKAKNHPTPIEVANNKH